jgi:hypothetical protein
MRIRQAVATCDALVAVIGRRWLNARYKGRRRLDDPQDFVHTEIATALTRKVPVIPVLVDGAEMPTAAQLPPPLAVLAHCNGMALRSGRGFRADVARLITSLANGPCPEPVAVPPVCQGATSSPERPDGSGGAETVLLSEAVFHGRGRVREFHGRGRFRELRVLDDDGGVTKMIRPCYYGEIENATLSIRGTSAVLVIDKMTMYNHPCCSPDFERISGRLEGHGSYLDGFINLRYRVEDQTRQLSWEGVCVLSVPSTGKIHGYWMTAGHSERGKTVLGTLELERAPA